MLATIAACSWETAKDPDALHRYPFRNCLIVILQEWKDKPFSAAILHAECLARLKHPRPTPLGGKPFEAIGTPVYFVMASNYRTPSIEICSLRHRQVKCIGLHGARDITIKGCPGNN
jgi:hypothetical protein